MSGILLSKTLKNSSGLVKAGPKSEDSISRVHLEDGLLQRPKAEARRVECQAFCHSVF